MLAVGGCGGLMAWEFGDHPEATMARMGLDLAACGRDACQLR
jgi:hypothetical protein